jgi:hypothetical protein
MSEEKKTHKFTCSVSPRTAKKNGDVEKRDYRSVDWDAMLPDWKAGIVSTAQIAENYAATHDGHRPFDYQIVDHFKRLRIPRDLKDQVVLIAEVKAKQDNGEVLTREEELLLAARQLDDGIIDVSASAIAGTLIGHRKQVKQYHNIVLSLLGEIEEQTANAEDFKALGELMYKPDAKGVDKLNAIYEKVLATPQRVDSVKKLVETSKILIGLERQALGIADNANGDANKGADEAGALPPEEVAKRVAFMLMAADVHQQQAARKQHDIVDAEVITQEVTPSQEVTNWEGLA